MDWLGRNRSALVLSVVLVGLNLIAFNILVSGWSRARIDLTEDRLFSISDATRRILDGIEGEVTIIGYFSERTHPKLAPLVPEIADLLDEYAAISRGKVHVEMIDPGEDREAEEEAGSRFGVSSTPFEFSSKYETGIVNAYFALVVKYGDQYERYSFSDLIDVVPLPDGDIEIKLRNLEYDLTRAIKKTVSGFRGTAAVFSQIEGPVKFTTFISKDSLPELFQDVPQALATAVSELSEAGGEKFLYEDFDPSKDEQVADRAYREYGVRPMSLGLFSDASFYLQGFLEVSGQVEQIVLIDEGVSAAKIREAIEASLRRHTPGFLKTVGIVAPQPSIPPELMMQYQMQGRMPPQPPPEFEQVKQALRGEYEVRQVDLDSSVPAKIDTLVVVKPSELSERAVYNLDQYLMRGGRIIICSGQFDVDLSARGLNVRPLSSGLDEWLAHFGVTIEKTLVLDDQNQTLPIPEVRQTPLGMVRTWSMAPYPYLVEVRGEGFVNRQIAGRVAAMGIYWGSPIKVEIEEGSEWSAEDVLRSSDRSWLSDDTTQVSRLDYVVPEEEAKAHTLAVSLSGRFESYFKDRAIPSAENDADDEPVVEGEESSEVSATDEVALERSPDTRLVVIGNAAFLSDFVATALGRLEGGYFAENLGLMKNLIDWANEDNDMLDIRARGVTPRRLDRLDPATEVSLEVFAYALPTLLLLLFGFARLWKRRHAGLAVTEEG